jgi:hypothetical protein
MNEPAIPMFLQEIANAFGAIDGVEAVTWCGSSALGEADTYSDFDRVTAAKERKDRKDEETEILGIFVCACCVLFVLWRLFL